MKEEDTTRPPSICRIFAFGTNLRGKGKTELDRYLNLPDNEDTVLLPYLGALCVAQKACFAFGIKSGGASQWRPVIDNGQSAEVLAFIGSLIDTIPELRLMRGFPSWSHYFVP